jgi:transcriptional regulator with XRE-family HTH domain
MSRMQPERFGRIVRMLRVRHGFTQAALGLRAGVSREAVSLIERGQARRLRLRTVEGVLGALGARTELRLMWNGPELDRMLDAVHAWIGASVKRRVEAWGWVVKVEVSFNHYGERGRIDLLAWHGATRTLLVVEVKSALVDVQQLLGSLDVKTRIGRQTAARFGWEVRHVVPAIVFADDRTTRRRLAVVDTLFDRFAVRGRACISWPRHPGTPPSGVLWFVLVPPNVGGVIGRQRVRKRRAA